ncbi:hypothetical protein M1105_06830 [Limibaculum sp. FT325]|uniref:hypothetical protein n=1 Tax=Thermohalobaculum sediminis TaxID=2939436 RepID=UPI0020C12674|nr:hypothetical protein [Limibaculum sediminis]MCL5776700.1 hypothetical protein [Limibaculum sediminis]
MNRLDSRLADLLGPVRDVTVGALLEVLARRLDSGAEIEAEPMQREGEGRVARDGTLQLPRRGDLRVTAGGRSLVERVASPAPLAFAPVTLVEADGFVTTLSPFRWDAAAIVVTAAQPRPNWAPIRRWFLEWFQSRYADVAPDLAGAVHSIDGPEKLGQQWRFTADLGSAPIECISDLIGAFVATGASRIHIGEPEG